MIKKIIALALIFCLLFVLTACSDSSEKIDNPDEAADAIEKTSEDLSDVSNSLDEINNELG